MTALLNFALVIGIVALVGASIAYAIAHGQDVIRDVFRLGREPGWPRGVQEDDPPARWKLPPSDPGRGSSGPRR